VAALYYCSHSNDADATGVRCTERLSLLQWRSQDLEVGEAQGVWGTEVPQRGPGAEPLVGLGGEAPRKLTSY